MDGVAGDISLTSDTPIILSTECIGVAKNSKHQRPGRSGTGRQATVRVLRGFAAKANKKAARVPGLGTILLANDLAKNPWHVAKTRAAMTGAVVADLLARTDQPSFILVGHSLGARVMVTAAQSLGTRQGTPKIETMHLLGAAVGARATGAP